MNLFPDGPANYLGRLQSAVDRLDPKFRYSRPHSQVHNQTPNHCRILQSVVFLAETPVVCALTAVQAREWVAVYMSLPSIVPRICRDFAHQTYRGCCDCC